LQQIEQNLDARSTPARLAPPAAPSSFTWTQSRESTSPSSSPHHTDPRSILAVIQEPLEPAGDHHRTDLAGFLAGTLTSPVSFLPLLS
jgi:hypothetical protein